MAFDLSTLGTYSTADQIKAVDHAIVTILLGGQGMGTNGRSITRADLTQLRELRAELVTRAADEDSTSAGGIALVQYGERV